MGAADLDDGGERFGFFVERGAQMLQRRNQAPIQFGHRRDMHRRREAIVRGLAEIDMVVGVDRAARAQRLAEHLVGAIRQHLVHVHVGLGAGAGLPHDQRELAIVFAGDRFVRRRDDRLAEPGVERAERDVGHGGGPLNLRQGVNQRQRHALGRGVADAKIPARALCLRAPIALRRYVDRAHAVAFDARVRAPRRLGFFGAGHRRHKYSAFRPGSDRP